MRIDEEITTASIAAIAAKLAGMGIDLKSKGGRALLCCAYAALRNKGTKVKDLCAWYAHFKGSNVWAVHKSMSQACRKAACGLPPGKLVNMVVKEVLRDENGIHATKRG